jgi:hypothetical protein
MSDEDDLNSFVLEASSISQYEEIPNAFAPVIVKKIIDNCTSLGLL